MAAAASRLKAGLALLACVLLMAAGVRSADPQRIVSLIPATTEMLFAIGAGDRLVGAGSYDRFPPEVDAIPRVGGLLDPNTERILALRPDLVVVYNTQVELKERLERAGIPYYDYEHRALPDITATIRALGARVGAAAAAERVALDMERQLEAVRASVSGLPRPRTLLLFSRDTGSLRNIYASGGYGFLADLLDLAGGENVFAEIERQSVQVSTEMLLTLGPEVIIELRYGASAPRDGIGPELTPWQAVPAVPAVRSGQVHILVGDEFVVPGPRIVLAARRLAATMHPSSR